MDKKLPTSQMGAAKEGLSRYQGTPCMQGHRGIRYTRNGTCVECAKAAAVARTTIIRKLLREGGE